MTCSVTLLKNGVSDMGRRSSSLSGTVTFAIGVTHSIFHWSGHSPDCNMLLTRLQIGVKSSGAR